MNKTESKILFRIDIKAELQADIKKRYNRNEN